MEVDIELQRAFDQNMQMFAASIHLAHPQEELPFSVYTDVSQIATAGVLMQTDHDGNVNVISATTRVLSSAESRLATSG
jgi:hypothetical protein